MRWGRVIRCAAVLSVCCAVPIWAQPAGPGASDAPGAASEVATGSVPRLIRFSGAAPDLSSSVQPITFAIFDSAQAGTLLWNETQQVELDEQSNYTVMLGSTQSGGLPLSLFTSGKALWLEAQIAGRPEQPRTMLVAVPYALRAADADTLGGKPVSAFLMAPQPANSTATGRSSGTSSEPDNSSPTSGTSPAPLSASAGTSNSSGSTNSPTPCASVTSDGTGTANQLAKFTTPCNLTKSAVFESGTKVGIGTTAPAGTLDVNGSALVRGTLQLPPRGTATTTSGFSSQPEDWQASVFNSGSAAPLTEHFLWQAEPLGNGTATPSARLSLLSAAGTALPAETGLSISHTGVISFAAGQKFPGTGTGTITGVLPGTDLSGGGTSGTVTLSLNTTATDARYARLAAANSFTGNQSVTGSVTASGLLVGSRLSSTVGTGTAPLSVASTTQVANLNASLLGGFGMLAFARVAAANSFVGNQSINGNLSASGTIAAHTNSSSGSVAAFSNSNSSNTANALNVTAFGPGVIGDHSQGNAGNFLNNNTSGVGAGVRGEVNSIFGNNGTAGVYGVASGTGGYGGYFEHSDSSGFGFALSAVSNGEGTVGSFETLSTSNGQPTVDVIHDGVGIAERVTANNTNNTANALDVTTFGPGVIGDHSQGNAGNFLNNNTSGVGAGVRGEVNSIFGNNGTAGVYGVASGTGGYAGYFEHTETTGFGIALQVVTNDQGTGMVVDQEGSSGDPVVFQTAGTNVARIDRNGTGFFNGGTQLGGADLAEFVSTTGQPPQVGDVVEIDPVHPNCFRLNSRANTTRVAGVVSTSPGVTLNAGNGATSGVSGPALALAGRVPVKVTGEGGPVGIGDLLVASSTPGHAMRAPEHPLPGTVIGKSMEAFSSSEGVVEVLVMLR